jgi:hypothetical protein
MVGAVGPRDADATQLKAEEELEPGSWMPLQKFFSRGHSTAGPPPGRVHALPPRGRSGRPVLGLSSSVLACSQCLARLLMVLIIARRQRPPRLPLAQLTVLGPGPRPAAARNGRGKMAEMAVFRGAKAPFFGAWSRGFSTQALDFAAFMSADIFGAPEQEKWRAPFSSEDAHSKRKLEFRLPSLAFFDVARVVRSVFRSGPDGAKHTSPGHRPRELRWGPSSTLDHQIAPRYVRRTPRALPWAGLWLPLRGD